MGTLSQLELAEGDVEIFKRRIKELFELGKVLASIDCIPIYGSGKYIFSR